MDERKRSGYESGSKVPTYYPHPRRPEDHPSPADEFDDWTDWSADTEQLTNPRGDSPVRPVRRPSSRVTPQNGARVRPPRRPSKSDADRRRLHWQKTWEQIRANPVLLILLALVTFVALPAVAYTSVRELANPGKAGGKDHAFGVAGQPGLDANGNPISPSASGGPSSGPSGSPNATTGTDKPTGCSLNAILVPSCGHLVGAAPNAFSGTNRAVELRAWETKVGRKMDIFHMYHAGDELFPNQWEIDTTTEPGANRILLLNWKVAAGSNWAAVANGAKDARIDRLANYIKTHYNKKFFLALHHEPEEEVRNTAGSGWTAKDYGAMWRHVVSRMRADGVTNIVWTIIFMGFQGYSDAPWFDDLYPGDSYVDWIAYDPYMFADADGDFARLVNRATPKFPGFYTWAQTKHPSKPLMLAEWGIFESSTDKSLKPKMYNTVAGQINNFPAIKAICYFNSPIAPRGDTRVDSSAAALTAFRNLMGASTLQAHIL